MKKFLRGFSLVELIIVIAIIAILSVSAVMVLQKWIGESRDSRRLSDLETIKKSLTLNYADSMTSENYPMPDEAETVTGEDGETVWYQGYFGSKAMEKLDNLNKVPKDPRGTGYEYSVTSDQQTWEVYAKLENGKKVSLLTDEAYAKDERYIAKRGNYGGYIIGSTGDKYNLYNSPSLYIASGQLISGDINNVYQEGEATDNRVIVTGVDITDLKDDDTSNDETVYDKVKDKFGLDSVIEAKKVVKKSDGGIVNTKAPSGGSVIINGGDSSTASKSVTLNITCASDNVGMYITGDTTYSSTWESCITSKSVTLTSGDGTKTVYVKFKDSSGNVNSEVSDSISYSAQQDPTDINFSHTDEHKNVTLSWNGGTLNGNCDIKINSTTIATKDCDSNQNFTVSIESAISNSWSNEPITITAQSSSFSKTAGYATCSSGGSGNNNEDDDCDGTWDERETNTVTGCPSRGDCWEIRKRTRDQGGDGAGCDGNMISDQFFSNSCKSSTWGPSCSSTSGAEYYRNTKVSESLCSYNVNTYY